jgi:ABC-type transport system involved in cytochrome c biogenesis permease subunit
MTSWEGIAYALASIALVGSCGLHLVSARISLLAREGGNETQSAVQRLVRHSERLATLSAALALLALGAGLAVRGIAAARWPLGSPFEFTLAFAGGVALVYLGLYRTAGTSVPGAIATLLALALMLHAFFVQAESARAIQDLPPVMNGIWFSLHTLLTSVAYGALAVAGSVALGNLAISSLATAGFVDWAMDVGYVTLSLGIIAGAVWGEQAWAEYWSWSIKETWTLITWWVCTFYDHVRRRPGWRGRRAMGVAFLALLTVLVTFLATPSLVRWTRLQRLFIY